MALSNFIGRRGKPSEVFYDNGKNFVGELNQLRELLSSLNENDDLYIVFR